MNAFRLTLFLMQLLQVWSLFWRGCFSGATALGVTPDSGERQESRDDARIRRRSLTVFVDGKSKHEQYGLVATDGNCEKSRRSAVQVAQAQGMKSKDNSRVQLDAEEHSIYFVYRELICLFCCVQQNPIREHDFMSIAGQSAGNGLPVRV